MLIRIMKKLNLLLAFLVAATFSSCITTQQSGTSMLEKNSLGKWKPTDFAGHGDVTVKNGVLKLGMGIELIAMILHGIESPNIIHKNTLSK